MGLCLCMIEVYTNGALDNFENKVKESKSLNTASQDSEEVVIAESKPKAKDKVSESENKASTEKTKGKFYIQIAAYSSSERAKKTSSKLKDLNVSTYTIERKKESDNGTLYLVRSGPYSSKDEAQQVVKKIAELDLSPKIIEMKASQ